ncbi:hypothetical protein SSX86_012439 [Deinandra increscens subsp. villosa]|uniref:chitinase n=1 Tax=Deinandra increscens subsp. villosa TaxID=3103831 RepID=A0AAP0D8D5_9ASTR
MAIKLYLLVFTLALLVLAPICKAGQLVVYWGQDARENRLYDTCDSKKYDIVNIAFLFQFGNGQPPLMNLAGHCDPSSPKGCQHVSTGIHHCQSLGTKVMLSIGGDSDTYSLSSADDAREVADYIWNNFLGGQSDSRPLGDAVLDGVDFDIEKGEPHYAALARRLHEHGQQAGGKRVYLTAAPQCPFPDVKLNRALSTNLFDYIWVQFYNNPQCEFNANNMESFMSSWRTWTSTFSSSTIFIGVPASSDAECASNGYIPRQQMLSKVLPFAQMSQNYGGVMLWNRYFDGLKGYGDAIKSNL